MSRRRVTESERDEGWGVIGWKCVRYGAASVVNEIGHTMFP